MALQASYRRGWKTQSRSNWHLSIFWTAQQRRRNRNRIALLVGLVGNTAEKPVTDNAVLGPRIAPGQSSCLVPLQQYFRAMAAP